MRYIFLLIIIAVSIGSVILIVKPRYENLKQARTDVSSYGSSLDTAEKLKQSREELIAKYNAIPKNDLDSLKTLLPDAVDNIRLIIQIDSIAQKNNLSTLRDVDYQKVEDIQTSPSADGGEATTIAPSLPYGDLSLSFQTAGTYANFLAFVADLEQNLRLVDIVSVDFSTNEGQQGQQEQSQNPGSNLTYQVTLKTYWLKK